MRDGVSVGGMELWFDVGSGLGEVLREVGREVLGEGFEPEVRPADTRHGDFQANGILAAARRMGGNPRKAAEAVVARMRETDPWGEGLVEMEVAGPGFLNFRLSPRYLLIWLERYGRMETMREAARSLAAGKRVVVDFSSPNTAKEMHVGHIRSTVIGESIARMLEFCGAEVVRDNHVGDWGTQFGMLIWAVKRAGYDLANPGPEALRELEALYQEANRQFRESPEAAAEMRQELVRLQAGEAENLHLWEMIRAVSWQAFEEIYQRFGIRFDEVLGESFYRDQVDAVCDELRACGIAVEDSGALVVFHPEHPRFARQPFIVRKADGASNYATTDLATVLYRRQELGAELVLYVVDSRQSDHFEQLFLTVVKWFAHKGLKPPEMVHVNFGTVLGEDGRPIKTKEGGSIKLRHLIEEAVQRSLEVVQAKNPDLPEAEAREIAEAVGLGALRYADLSQNRTSDYVFSWEKMLSFEGNTAPYLLYAVARLHSIFRKAGLEPGEGEEGATEFATPTELALARKLVAFGGALRVALTDYRPHLLCNYLYDLAGQFSAFYTADKVMVEDPPVRGRRLMLCTRTLRVLETGLGLLGLQTLRRM